MTSVSIAIEVVILSVAAAVPDHSTAYLFPTTCSLLPQLINDPFLSRFVKVNVKCFLCLFVSLCVFYLTTPLPLTSSTFTVHIPFSFSRSEREDGRVTFFQLQFSIIMSPIHVCDLSLFSYVI